LNTHNNRSFPKQFFSFWEFFLRVTFAAALGQHDQDVIEMNEVRRRASGRVQRTALIVAHMIDGPGHPTGDSVRSPL